MLDLVVFVDTVADLGRHRSGDHVRLAVYSWRRLAGRQLPETEGAARESVQDAEDRRMAGQTSENLVLDVRTTSWRNERSVIAQISLSVSVAVLRFLFQS